MGRTKILPPPDLLELALAYRVRPFPDHSRDMGTSLTVFPISHCSLDVLLMIFQELIDEEAASYSPLRSKDEIKPRAAPLLALVCRQWRDIVYNTPRLWAVIVVDVALYVSKTSISTQPAQTQHYVQRAKGAPVDLYLFGYSAPHCEDTHITNSILSIVPNIRKLYVQFVATTEMPTKTPLLLTRAWPALLNTRELSYSALLSNYPITADLTAHFRGIPRLNILRLRGAGFTVPRWSTGPPVLPQVRSMLLERSYSDGLCDEGGRLTSLLSHTPLIEELDLAINPWRRVETTGIPSISPGFTLSHLHTVKSRGASALEPLLNQEISAPAITNITLVKWMNSDNPTDNQSVLAWFARLSDTLTTLVLPVTDSTDYCLVLASLVKLDTLSLISEGAGRFLAPLYEPIGPTEKKGSSREMASLPSLRFLILSICRPLVAKYFKKLVAARCIPVDAQRATAAGCPALENFVILTRNATEHLNNVSRTAAWHAAAVQESNGIAFELRWESEEAEEAGLGRKKPKTKNKAPKQAVRRSVRAAEIGSKARGKSAKKRQDGG